MQPNEIAVIGAVLIDESSIEKISKIVSSVDFTGRNIVIFKAIESLINNNVIPDIASLSTHLREIGELDRVGGPSYIAEIIDQTVTASNVGFFAKKVRSESIVRKIKAFASELINHRGNADELVKLVEDKAFSFDNKGANEPVHISVGAKAALKTMEDAHGRPGVQGIGTGVENLDKILNGLQPGKVYLIAGRPGMGKSAMGVNIMQANPEVASLFVTMEMEAEEVAQRALCSYGKVDSSRVATGQLVDADWSRLTMASGKIAASKIWVDDTPAQSMEQIYSTARKFKRKHNLGLLVIDYLQLVDGSGSEYEIIGNASKMMKRIAKELKIPVVVLSQLNRSLESRDDKRPRLSDLRGTGQIEQDADVIVFPFREAVYCGCKGVMHCEKGHQRDVELIVAKHRGGRIGMVTAKFIGEHTTFTD